LVRRELGADEPTAREFVAAIRHVLATEYAKPKHFGRCQIRAEPGTELASGWDCQLVAIALLHPVIDFDDSARHRSYFPYLTLSAKTHVDQTRPHVPQTCRLQTCRSGLRLMQLAVTGAHDFPVANSGTLWSSQG
jgi:hypothetical protein